jgi:hypothetical protein
VITFDRPLTDRQKLEAFWEAFGFESNGDNTFTAGGRRYFFTDSGELEKIIDYSKVRRFKGLTKTKANGKM